MGAASRAGFSILTVFYPYFLTSRIGGQMLVEQRFASEPQRIAPVQPLGGQAARMGIRPNKSQEAILAAVINHPELLHRHSETLAAQAFPRRSRRAAHRI